MSVVGERVVILSILTRMRSAKGLVQRDLEGARVGWLGSLCVFVNCMRRRERRRRRERVVRRTEFEHAFLALVELVRVCRTHILYTHYRSGSLVPRQCSNTRLQYCRDITFFLLRELGWKSLDGDWYAETVLCSSG